MHAVKARPGEPLEWLAERIANADRSECWEWPFARMGRGYGAAWDGAKVVGAHRIALQLDGVALADDQVACHRCDNPACVNPDHLFVGTQSDNIRDAVAKGRHFHAGLRGEDHGRSKLTETQVLAIRADGRPKQAIAADYGMSRIQVSKIKRGAAWGWLS